MQHNIDNFKFAIKNIKNATQIVARTGNMITVRIVY